eukprot:TRINITY_DN94848_c0_g1_i1.p1 TRINITY_DN94848_c0_g1~~TRINITY_DN94848_c0_g1_i1.p1  ORF type:complete len:292 (+),score=47.40 TRINITY_DN94848_c0_g1_i1:111-878(+)
MAQQLAPQMIYPSAPQQKFLPVVAGQVIAPSASALASDPELGTSEEGVILTGTFVPGPWHESELNLPEELQLARGDTGTIVSSYRKLGKRIVFSSLTSIVTSFVVCSACIWYSQQHVERKCEARLPVLLLQLGALNGIQGILAAWFLGVALLMLSAMSHGAIASKYMLEGREDEASSEETDFENEASVARSCIRLPTLLWMIVMFFLALLFVQGVGIVLSAHHCGISSNVLLVLLGVTLLNNCASAVSGRSAVSM